MLEDVEPNHWRREDGLRLMSPVGADHGRGDEDDQERVLEVPQEEARVTIFIFARK